MNVYVNKINVDGYYCGMIIVAANNEDEAHEVMTQNITDINSDYYYKRENWRLLNRVYCDTPVPIIIDEDRYIE